MTEPKRMKKAAAKKPVLRGGKKVVKIADRKQCPIHSWSLDYNASNGYWSCPNEHCTYRLVPVAEADRGSAVVEHGPFELFAFDDTDHVRNYFIRSLKSNVVFDITDHIESIKGTGEDTRVTMKFDNVAIKEASNAKRRH